MRVIRLKTVYDATTPAPAMSRLPEISAKRPPSGAGRGRGRGRGLGLGDTRRETVEAAAARARIARRKAAAKAAAVAGSGSGTRPASVGIDGGDFEDADENDDDFENDATDVGHDPDAPLFADAPYDDDDREADDIYAAVEQRMRQRRLKHTEARIQRELQQYRSENPTVPQQFVDLKRKLADISENDWASIPDIGDRSIQRRRIEKITPAPDFLLHSAVSNATASVSAAVAPEQGLTSALTAPSSVVGSRPSVSSKTDLARISEGRSSVIEHNLDTASDSVTGQTNIDPTGYLTQMAGMHVSSDSEVSDIRKARLLLRSVTTTNPKHAPGWIAAARLEEVAGKLSTARTVITQACEYCPSQEDVWLEAARLHPPEEAKAVLADAVKHVPKSVKIWLQAAALECDVSQKKRVLRKALQIIPTSAKLWRSLVDLEDPKSARVLLSHAVECVPGELDLWLGLARLETYENAKKVLNRGLQHLRGEPALWITGAKLEEANLPTMKEESDNIVEFVPPTAVRRPVSRAVQTLSVDDDVVTRERWLEEACDAEKAGFPATCCAIVSACLEVGVEAIDRMRVWIEDAKQAESRSAFECGREIYRTTCRTYPGDEDAWKKFAEYESRQGNVANLRAVLEAGVARCPRAEVLWLMVAKEVWKAGLVEDTRVILARAFQANPNSEAILLAAAKVETDIGQESPARSLLAKARKNAPSARVCMKSALLERMFRNRETEADLLEEGLDNFPDDEKLWLMMAQWHERNEQPQSPFGKESTTDCDANESGQHGDAAARSTYNSGLRHCPKSIPLWLGLARLEERRGLVTKARAVLENARAACKDVVGVDQLWEESVRIEERANISGEQREFWMLDAGDSNMRPVHSSRVAQTSAQMLVSRALKECGESGRLWALAIALEPKARQRAKSVDALRKCDQNPFVLLQIGKLFWRERKLEKARDWLKRAIKADSLFGDAYATLHAFERCQEHDAAVEQVENDAQSVVPRYGDLWIKIRKGLGNESLSVVDVLRRASAIVTKLETT